MKSIVFLFLGMVLSGCASFGKGVAEAFLEKQDSEDKRVCQVRGKRFDGLEPTLKRTQGTSKVLMVHGVGSHLPGYSTEFLEKLALEMGLAVEASDYKELRLADPDDQAKKLGTLRIRRLLNSKKTKELLFYELTWSEITNQEKSILAYDNSGEYSYRRADINDMLKKFSNDTGPDPMIYLGESHNDIIQSFLQSFCWMVGRDWQGLPSKSNQPCTSLPKEKITTESLKNMGVDDYAIVSHSLGSRITMDSMNHIAQQVSEEEAKRGVSSKESEFIDELRKKHIPLFMLSNQLPLLQMGRNMPQVTGQNEAYCTRSGKHYGERTLTKTSLIAFSDPNDILSYAIPPGFADRYLDSRLCIDVTNININVANVADLFGLGEVANPLTAHTGYDSDHRVIALIAKGIGNPKTSGLVKKRCDWTQLVD